MSIVVLDFTCDIVPKKNALRAGISKRGKLFQYKSQKARTSQNMLAWQAAEQARTLKWSVVDQPVQVVALIRKRRGDCIGAMETILDALEGIIYENDRQVHNQCSRWAELPEGITARVWIDLQGV